MPTIDIHTHILPEQLPDFKQQFGYGGFVTLDHHRSCAAKMLLDDGSFFREIQSNCWDPKVRIQESNEAGIDLQVLSPIPVMFYYWAKPEHAEDLARFLNDYIAGVVDQNPQRFVGLGTLPMQCSHLKTGRAS